MLQIRIEDCKILHMAQDIPVLTLQEKTSLEGVITLVKASVLCLKYEKNYRRLGSNGFTADSF